ncbi:MAG: thiamine-phosphate kinase [Desulfosarcinaceae bacterium]
MKIKDFGGEFKLIDRLAAIASQTHGDLVAGIGDDAAVIRTAPDPAPYLLVTTDLLVEGSHFSNQWCGPEAIGRKAVACNASDIAAMGGRPTWMFVSLVLTPQTEVAWVEALYRGMSLTCRSHGIVLAGGDTTHGPNVSLSITLLGSVPRSSLCLRSQAQPGDVIMVTGTLGASAAALALLEKGHDPGGYLLDKHCSPGCRLDISDTIAPLANAMIDISDGLGSEVRHICRQSGVGAEIAAECIPLHSEVLHAAAVLDADPVNFALEGGEDYELLFTLSPEGAEVLEKRTADCRRIGVVTHGPGEPVLVLPGGARRPMPGGYNHFGD